MNRIGVYSSVAQLAERSAVNRMVVGSSPTRGARTWTRRREADIPLFLSCQMRKKTKVTRSFSQTQRGNTKGGEL